MNQSSNSECHELVQTEESDLDSLAASIGAPAWLPRTGCFLMRDCIAPVEVERIHMALKRLFGRAATEKLKFQANKLANPLSPGFSPYGVAKAIDTGSPNLLETWDIGDADEKWPPDCSADYSLFLSFQSLLFEIGIRAATIIQSTLSRSVKDLVSLLPNKPEGLHLIHYFPVPEKRDQQSVRQSRHCDNTLMTVIPSPFPAGIGLAVADSTSETWHDIVIPKHACLIQAGNILRLASGGAIPACLHTVHTPAHDDPRNTSRYSTPLFMSPSPSMMVKDIVPVHAFDPSLAEVTVAELQRKYFQRIFGSSR